MTIRAILFDLDGTLLDTLADIGHSANAVLEANGFPTYPLERYRQFIGEGVARLFEQALPAEARQPEVIARCVAGFHDRYERNWNVHSRPFDGINELLDALTQRGVRLAVLSNKPDEFTRRCVAHYFPRWSFAAVLGQREGIPRKPDPAGAREIAASLAIPAEQMLYLGDSAVDMQTARAAGMFPVGATWGFRSVEELQASGARALVHHPHELLSLLDQLQTAPTNRMIHG